MENSGKRKICLSMIRWSPSDSRGRQEHGRREHDKHGPGFIFESSSARLHYRVLCTRDMLPNHECTPRMICIHTRLWYRKQLTAVISEFASGYI